MTITETVMLHSAAKHNDEPLIRDLLDSGVDPESIEFDQTPLEVAITKGSVEAIHALISGGASVNGREANPSVCIAIREGQIGSLVALDYHGANINSTFPNGVGGKALARMQTCPVMRRMVELMVNEKK